VRVGSIAAAGITHGQQVNAGNTGIAAQGLVDGDLTSTAGTTYSTNGQTITNRLFTGTVTVSGSNVTLVGCKFAFGGGANTKGLVVTGSNVTVQNCTFAPTSGSWYMGIHAANGTGLVVDYCDVSGCENNMTIETSGVTVRRSYMHDSSNASAPAGHKDVIEIYGGNDTVIELSRLVHPADETAVINIAPWFGSTSVDNTRVQDCFIDGGHMHFVVDVQSSGQITNTRVLRNRMGGHTTPGVIGRYSALNDSDGRGTVGSEVALAAATSKILWPTSGADLNTWQDCADLSPDRTGETVIP
jgi:hypothetical protein